MYFIFYKISFIYVYKRKINFYELFWFQREESDDMFAENRACGGTEISYTKNKKVTTLKSVFEIL